MRTLTPISVLVCFAVVALVAREAGALRVTFDRAPQTVSTIDPTHLPLNLAVSPDLHEVAAHMLRESESFRRQCRIIGRHPQLRVQIVLEDRPGRERAARARCDLARYEFGAIKALVHVWFREDAIELIAHELEHVIEFVEGANYRGQAVVQRGSVWAADGGAFETTRAIEMGLQVKREVAPAIAHRRR